MFWVEGIGIRCEVGVLELLVHFTNGLAEVFHLLKHIVEALAVGEAAARTKDGVEHGTELLAELAELLERLLHDGRELQKTESVSSRRSVEDDNLVLHALDLLQDFGETHGLVNTRNAEGHILEHVADAAKALHCFLCIVATSRNQVLDRAVGVDLHGGQVLDARHRASVLAELDTEGIAEVVCRVGGDEEDRLAGLSHLDCQGARGGGFAYTTLAADEDPFE